jgi:hypothetical protein
MNAGNVNFSRSIPAGCPGSLPARGLAQRWPPSSGSKGVKLDGQILADGKIPLEHEGVLQVANAICQDQIQLRFNPLVLLQHN